MTIDLRWLLPVVAFSAPGLLMLISALALGAPLRDALDDMAAPGLLIGLLAAVMPTIYVASGACPPMRVRLWGRGDE